MVIMVAMVRVSIDLQWGKLKNGIYCQAIADIWTKVL